MKRALLLALLLAGCASYQPNVPAAEQAKPDYADDLARCTHQMEDTRNRLYNGFGLVGLVYGEAKYTADEVHESEQLSNYQGQHAFINFCMTKKGYTVQP